MTTYPIQLTDPRLSSPLPVAVAIHKVERLFPAHRHDFLEISLVIGGYGEEVVNGAAHPMMPGTLSLVLPFHVHELRANPGQPLRLYNCMFGVEMLRSVGEELERLKERLLEGSARRMFLQLSEAETGKLAALFEELREEYDQRRSLRSAMLKTRLTELLIRVDRLQNGGAEGQPEQERPGMPEKVWKVVSYMHNRYQEQLSLSGLANTFHMNRTYLSEELRRHTGKSFLQLLHEIRLRQACALLASTDMTICAIAYEAGYGSSQTLHKAFLKYKGTTPGEYRGSLGAEGRQLQTIPQN
ncbi:AraC family transcriptional regulator [Paenibacillus sp. YN15]|uniref:AraC family transcriptional regulator n=1 Tax=Paenibacillus sp. YN15 TaxID=1742774 RepID=UPI000DCCC2B4|nr:AraC family transcriptional regulator [Paenibacillus sp. YN15]RAV01439.1 AraC family transcriptional regulator [Paenibacillus sp. YN15]